MNEWHNICITDKSGKEMFKCTASPMSTMSEIRNLKRRIEQAKANPKHYAFMDVATAVIMLDGTVYSEHSTDNFDADALLAELGL